MSGTMSAIGTKRTYLVHCTCPLLGVKGTWPFAGVGFRGRYWGKADMAWCIAHVRF